MSHHTVNQVLVTEPRLDPPQRFPRYREIAGRVSRHQVVVTLYLDN